MDKRMLQTQFSVKASTLADSFRSTVGRLRVGPYGYTPDLTAPEGPSTSGGVQAMQHVRLLPPQPNMPTLVVGHANQRDGAASLRTWDHVDAICRERFKQGAPLDPAQYGQFLQSAQGFLAACGLRVAFAGPPADLTLRGVSAVDLSTPPPRRASGLVVGIMAGMLVTLVAGCVVWLAVFRG
jgi:hypothetical protein